MKLKSKYIWLHAYYYLEKRGGLCETDIVLLSYKLIGRNSYNFSRHGSYDLANALYDEQN